MKPINKYLIQAAYDWISDSNMTPYIVVDISSDKVDVPREYAKDGIIVLNISMASTVGLAITDESVSFSARFGGAEKSVYIPISSVDTIYAKESGAAVPLPKMVEVDSKELAEKEKEDKKAKFKIVK